METCEKLKSNAYAWLNKQIKADKLRRSIIHEDVRCLGPIDRELQITGLIKLCEILDIPYMKVDWNGNEHCGTNYKELYFLYNGYKFFQLEI